MEAILTAAVQVLERDGVEQFTMKNVAERAGVSIGSLYQYFPNKAAILFRLQCDEWRDTSTALLEILDDESHPPAARVRNLVHAYLRSEVAEAPYRLALDDAAPFYRELPESEDMRVHVRTGLGRFIERLDPTADEAARRRVLDDTEQSGRAVLTATARGRRDPGLRGNGRRHALCVHRAPCWSQRALGRLKPNHICLHSQRGEELEGPAVRRPGRAVGLRRRRK